MSKPTDRPSTFYGIPNDDWQARISRLAERFNREYRGETFELPEEVEAMPIFRDWAAGKLQSKMASRFWELAEPKKNQRCLDLGCGVSFLIYPWWEWGAFFYGREISNVARDALKARAPQLNSKLFKGVELGAAHELENETIQFDLAIATGFSCYFPLEYWEKVLSAVKRVLKPGSSFVFDAIDPDAPLAEDWAILETYLGAEVFLEPLAEWDKLLKSVKVKKIDRRDGELFAQYKVQW
ncbi:MAG TPA: class I SAM-dependent methyltransferase [Oscillatoriales cyanobacterium M59_W2019_021]|nr:MAG: class I SAM-dependent methyltransferase [Cyanobacteria bacterium J055]HIK31472.1 class I SAM-dependent methyltransferase [Oscillatoriales cyanobacterium M4454_W2019_049]HIK51176.1 class I SAM-dependent methyltransferase [Oscillatoriales cyanobacterium M59_W2019_021]